MTKQMSFKFTASVTKVAKILEMLGQAQEGLTAQQIATRLHVTDRSANFYLKHLREAEPKQIRIADFKYPEGKGSVTPIYTLGSAPDAVHKKLTIKQRQRRARKQLYEDPERYAQKLADRRTRYWNARGPKIDAVVAHLHTKPHPVENHA